MLPLETCTACTACTIACPQKCISMNENKNGFYYPIIRNDKCIRCNRCEKVCPVIHFANQNNHDDKHVEINAVKSLNIQQKIHSSSGGIFPLLAEHIIRNNGIVYGAAFEQDFSVHHIAVNSLSDLHRLQGSKYIQSNLGSTFANVEKNLRDGLTVLFTGTPCQIAGLSSFLGKHYTNLFTADLVCHGVPSLKVFREYQKCLESNAQSALNNIFFRDKTHGWRNYSVKKKFANGQTVLTRFDEDSYMRAFIHNLSLRKSCYSCPFKGINGISDITLGDLWGADKICPDFDDNKGISVVTIHSIKGKQIFESIKGSTLSLPVNKELLYKYNRAAIEPVKPHNFHNYFFAKLGKKDFSELVKECENPSVVVRIERKLIDQLVKCRRV